MSKSSTTLGESASTPARGPDFIIAGAMRCGTTAIVDALRKHPQVRILTSNLGRPGADDAEFHYFDRGYLHEPVEWYCHQFDVARIDSRSSDRVLVVGEKTPAYLSTAAALQRIAEAVPDTKIVVALRDPVTRFFSQIGHYNFATFGARQAEYVTADQVLEGRDDVREDMLWRGVYSEQLQVLLQLFDRSQIDLIYAEEMRGNPISVMESLQRFLGVAPTGLLSPTHDRRQQIAETDRRAAAFLRDYYHSSTRSLFDLLGDAQIKSWSSWDPRQHGHLNRGVSESIEYPLVTHGVVSAGESAVASLAPVGNQTSRTRIILGIGSGRCGTLSLANLLNAQSEFHVTHEDAPLLPWRAESAIETIAARFSRMRRQRTAPVLGDVASFYLPYLEAAFELEPNLRVICLQRDRKATVDSFVRWLDTVQPLPTNHWSANPLPGTYHDPVWSQIFPKYEEQNLERCLERYWDEYYERAHDLAERHPDRMQVFPVESLNSDTGVAELLSFAGIPANNQRRRVGEHVNRPEMANRRRRPSVSSDDPSRCVILVPYQSHIVPGCEKALRELERRGYPVRRVSGYANIDQGRSQMATDALWDGFEETMWIDSDVSYHPDDVNKLRQHRQPIICGIYPKKGQRSLAAHVMPGTKQLTFGRAGGVIELKYAATGFLLVHRRAYEQMQSQLPLRLCNERFRKPMVPFFEPLTIRDDDGWWNLGEDYSFCHRARMVGLSILADTTIRLWHVGTYTFGWEDAGLERERFGTFNFNLSDS